MRGRSTLAAALLAILVVAVAPLRSWGAGLDGTNGVTWNNGAPILTSNTTGFITDLGTSALSSGIGKIGVDDYGALQTRDGANVLRKIRPGRACDIRDAGAVCDGSADDATAVSAAITACAGLPIWIPAGCVLGVSGPSASATKFSLPSGTSLICEDATAGFSLQSRRCSSASRYAGAACTADSHCNQSGSGTCDYDFGSTTFAPSGGSTYTLIDAESGATDIAITGCSFWVNGVSRTEADFPATTDPALIYTCNGGTNTGKPCLQYCDVTTTVGCNSDADCVTFSGGTTCINKADCATGGGNCWITASQPSKPSGDGEIVPINLSNATRVKIEDVNIFDHRQGPASIYSGSQATLTNIRTPLSAAYRQIFAPYVNTDIDGMIRLGALSEITRSTIGAIGAEVPAADNAMLRMEGLGARATNTAIYGGGASTAGVTDVSCVEFAAPQTSVVGNYLGNCWIGARTSSGGYNWTFSNNRVFSGGGPKVILGSSGNIVSGNYLAWNSTAANGGVVAMGDVRSGKYGVATGHPIITGNLIHTDSASGSGIVYPDIGKRCDAGTRSGLLCTTDDTNATTGCPGATCTGCCDAQAHSQALIAANNFMGTITTGIDLSALTGSNVTVGSSNVKANDFSIGSAGVGIKFPSSGTAVTKLGVFGNTASTITTGSFTSNLDGIEAILDGNQLVLPGEYQPQFKVFDGTSTIVAGNVVEPTSAADDRVQKASANSRTAIGCALEGATNGVDFRVAIGSVALCTVDGTAITRGDPVTVSSTAGALRKATALESVFGFAQETYAAQSAMRVLIMPMPAATTASDIVTTKGDLVGFNTTAARVPVGSNDLPLVADSTDAEGVVYKTLPIAGGGTSGTTATTGFNALDPLTTKGDIISHDGTNSVRVAVGTNAYEIVADSSATPGWKWTQAPEVRAVTGSDWTNATTTVSDVTGLTGYTVLQDKWYMIDGTLSVNLSAATGDPKFTVVLGTTTGAQLNVSVYCVPADGSATDSGRITTSGTEVTMTTAATGIFACTIGGWIEGPSSGNTTFKLQSAPAGTGTNTIHIGSVMRLTPF